MNWNLKTFKEGFFWKMYLLETAFIFLFYFIAKFFVKKIYGIIVLMQELGSELELYGDVSGDTITPGQAEGLTSLVGQLSSHLGQLVTYLIIMGVIIFLIYVAIYSVQWHFIQNKSLKNFKKYFWKFTFLSLFLFLGLVPLFFYVLTTSREFLLGYLFENSFSGFALTRLVIFSFLFLFFVYMILTGYILINKDKFLKAVGKIFSFEKAWLYFILLLVMILSVAVFRIGLGFGGLISYGIAALVIALLAAWYKIFLVENLEIK